MIMERRIYRGNFVNFMTNTTDFSVVRGSHYVLKIVDNNKFYFYEVVGGKVFDLPETTSLSTSVFTDWTFLERYIQDHHLFKRDGFFFQNDSKKLRRFEINFDPQYNWADKFEYLLPRDVILKLYDELGYFNEIVFIKSYLYEINEIVYQISEYQIDSDWYLYLGRRRLYDEVFSVSFEYNIKNLYTVRKEKEIFNRTCSELYKQYPMPYKFIRVILKACNNDVALCSQALSDILSTRKMFSAPKVLDITHSDELYMDYLVTADYYGFEHFIKNFRYLNYNFKFANRALKQQLADFMLGK